MANVLVLGVGPLPFEPGERLHAPGIRTWQIASALASRRHFVTLCVIEFGDFDGRDKGRAASAQAPPAVRQDVGTNISMVKLQYHRLETAASIRTLHMATRFSCVVSTTDIMNAVTADLELGIPLWLDYNGDPPAEKQLQARLYDHDGSLAPQWHLYLKGLARGDRFSVCSEAQRYALIGQLGFAGRLTGRTSGHDLVRVLPNCSRVMSERTPRRTTPLKGNQAPATAFLVLWSGGYNTWSDPETLFKGLESAMERNGSIYFATTGGALDGHDSRSFQIFQSLVEASALRDRFIFLGWIPTEAVGAYYEQADLAVFTDRYSVEGELGTRTRLVDWIQYGLPIACTELCGLTRELAAESLALTFEIGDSAALAEAILQSAATPDEGQDRAMRAKEWFDRQYDERAVFTSLLDWTDAPVFAPDRQPKGDGTAAAVSALSRLHEDAAAKAPGSAMAMSTGAGAGKPADGPSFKTRLRGIFGRKS